jgi:alpha-L-arabinofuranosidase
VEQCKNGVKSTLADKEGKLTAGQEYTIRVQKEGQRVRCYLNGEQIIDTHLREYADRCIFTSANIDQEEGVFYVKLVNPHPQTTPVLLSFINGRTLSGEAEVLSAPNGSDENTLTNPFAIVPHSQSVQVESDGTIHFEAAAYSLQATSLYFTCIANGNSKMYRYEELKKAIEAAGFELKEAHHNIGPNAYSLLRFRKK